MCGIVGFFSASATEFGKGLPCLDGIVDTLAHRGPDDRRVWVQAEAGIALGHRRLAIVDLSVGGRQPMMSHDKE